MLLFYQTTTVLVALAISNQSSLATTADTPKQQRHKEILYSSIPIDGKVSFHISTICTASLPPHPPPSRY